MAEHVSPRITQDFILDRIATANTPGNPLKADPKLLAQTIASYLTPQEFHQAIRLTQRSAEILNTREIQMDAAKKYSCTTYPYRSSERWAASPLGFHPIEEKESGHYFQAKVTHQGREIATTKLPIGEQVRLFREATNQTLRHLHDFITQKNPTPPHPNDLSHLVRFQLTSLSLLYFRKTFKFSKPSHLQFQNLLPRFQRLKCIELKGFKFPRNLDLSSLPQATYVCFLYVEGSGTVSFPPTVERIELDNSSFSELPDFSQYPHLQDLRLSSYEGIQLDENGTFPLPSSLRKLKIQVNDQRLDLSSSHIEELILTKSSVEKTTFPPSLRKITLFGYSWNGPIDFSNASTLKEVLVLHSQVHRHKQTADSDLCLCFHPSCKKIRLQCSFDFNGHGLDLSLSHLEEITLQGRIGNIDKLHLPESLKTLKLNFHLFPVEVLRRKFPRLQIIDLP